MKELRYLNKYLFKYRKKLLVGVVITIVARIFSLFAPRLIGNSLTAVEQFLNSPQADTTEIKEVLLINISVILAAALMSGFLTFLMRQMIINVSRYIEFDLKNEIYSHYQRLTQRFYKNNRTGDLMNRISEDVGKVRMYVGPAIMYSINTIALFVIVISYMVSIAPELTLYTVIPLPVLSITVYQLNRIVHRKSTVVQEMLSKISSFTQESFSGISVIKSYNLQNRLLLGFNNLINTSYLKNMDLAKVQAYFLPLIFLLISFSNLIVIFIGGKQYINGEIEIGILAEFIIYINMLTWPIVTIGWVTSVVMQAEASQNRINSFLKELPHIKDGPGVNKPILGNIEFNNVTLSYPETGITALDRVSFYLNSGETLGIVGKMGAGKSTILDLITRMYDPISGTITIDGIDIKKFKLNELRALIGYAPQNAFLFSESIESNIRFGNINASKAMVEEAAKNAAIAENIKGFFKGYDTLLGERGITLSGGQIQRISIARALVKDSKILLLDDCLSAVDTDTEEQILSNLETISQNKTTIIVSHRISSIKNADRIIVLKKGKIIQQGKHDFLVNTSGYYRELYKKQQGEKEK